MTLDEFIALYGTKTPQLLIVEMIRWAAENPASKWEAREEAMLMAQRLSQALDEYAKR